MIDEIKEKLQSLGYELKEYDDWLIKFLLDKVEKDIKNYCSISAIPDNLQYVVVETVTGEFLFNKKQSGQLEGFDVGNAIKSVQEGDTMVTYDTKNDENGKFDSLIAYLTDHRLELIKYRRLAW